LTVSTRRWRRTARAYVARTLAMGAVVPWPGAMRFLRFDDSERAADAASIRWRAPRRTTLFALTQLPDTHSVVERDGSSSENEANVFTKTLLGYASDRAGRDRFASARVGTGTRGELEHLRRRVRVKGMASGARSAC
jgi:hypothetical protein